MHVPVNNVQRQIKTMTNRHRPRARDVAAIVASAIVVVATAAGGCIIPLGPPAALACINAGDCGPHEACVESICTTQSDGEGADVGEGEGSATEGEGGAEGEGSAEGEGEGGAEGEGGEGE